MAWGAPSASRAGRDCGRKALSEQAISAPTIETERLRLRGHRLDDFAACVALWADPEVTRYIGGRPFSEEETWTRLLRYAGHWTLLGFGYWVVEERSTGRFLGEVGLADYLRDIEPAFGGTPEMGWVLAPSAHGKGYATEAVHTALAWAATHLASPETVCMIRPDNAASLRVAAKCGYREFHRTTYKGSPTVLFRR